MAFLQAEDQEAEDIGLQGRGGGGDAVCEVALYTMVDSGGGGGGILI